VFVFVFVFCLLVFIWLDFIVQDFDLNGLIFCFIH